MPHRFLNWVGEMIETYGNCFLNTRIWGWNRLVAQSFEIFCFNIQSFIYVSFTIVATVVRQRSGLEEAGIGQSAEEFSIFVIYRFCPYGGLGFLNATPCQNSDSLPVGCLPISCMHHWIPPFSFFSRADQGCCFTDSSLNIRDSVQFSVEALEFLTVSTWKVDRFMRWNSCWSLSGFVVV